MNLSLTNECNRRCGYCFQKSWYLSSDKIPKKELTIQEVENFMRWLPPEMQSFSIMGGEPLLYSDINRFFYLCRKYNKKVNIITNASIDTELFKKIITRNRKYITGMLINSNYPDSQKNVFLENIKFLLLKNIHFSISSTLLPDTDEIMKSADIISEILDMIECPSCKEQMHIRISPMAPNHLSNFKFYDYSLDIINFILKIWEHGFCNIGFDCTVNCCELRPEVIEKLKTFVKPDNFEQKIELRTEPCLNYGAFDYLVDGSVIYCSSCPFLKVENAISEPYNIVKAKLRSKWVEYWNNTGLLCDYKNCEHFGPAKCLGLCAAKNHVLNGMRYESN